MVGLFGSWIRKEGQGDHAQKDLLVHGSHQFMPSELQQLLAQPASNNFQTNEPFQSFTFKVWTT